MTCKVTGCSLCPHALFSPAQSHILFVDIRVLHACLQTVSHIPNIEVDVAHNKDGLLQDYTMLLTGIVTIVLLGVDMF